MLGLSDQREVTALELTTRYGIVRQAGGVPPVDSVEGKGSAFKVHLPVVELSGDRVGASGV